MTAGLVLLAKSFTRDSAREAAHRELSKPIYARERPSLLERGWEAVVRWFAKLFERLTAGTPGLGLGVLALVAIAVVLVVLLRARLGPLRGATGSAQLGDGGRLRTAAELRAEAADFAARQEWAEAVRARFRALARGLEERDLLEPRPGRTAAEVAAEAGRVLPAAGSAVRDAARAFDEIWYGGRPASAAALQRVADADDLVTRTRPVADLVAS